MLEVSYTISRVFFTCGPGNEERRLVRGALIQNLKNEAPLRKSLLASFGLEFVFSDFELPISELSGVPHSQSRR